MSKSKKVTKGKVSADNKDKDTDRGFVGDSSKKPDTESKVASSMDSSGRYTDTCQRCGRPKHTGTCRTPMALPVGSTLPLAERVANEKSVVTESKVASSMDSSGRYTDTCQRCGRPKHTGTCRTPMALPVGSTLPLAERVANEKSVVADPKASLDESKPSGTGVAPKR
jgi:ribosomal protein S14